MSAKKSSKKTPVVWRKPDGSVVYDVKHVLPRNAVDGRL